MTATATPRDAGVESLVLLGCGKMGSALLRGWLGAGLAPGTVQVIEPYPSDWLTGLTAEGLTLNPAEPRPATLAVLAVKPQMMAEAAPALADMVPSGTLFVSIAAGTPIEAFEGMLGAEARIVRAMPNTPSAIGRGVTALVANGPAGEAGLAMAEAMMSAVGATVRLDAEDQMHAVTGLSGSGPAYVFHMIEAMAEAGKSAGLPPDLAMTLARATVSGAAALAEAEAETPASTLRENVTSPGGTTAAGLGVLGEELTGLMSRTVGAAADRSRALASG